MATVMHTFNQVLPLLTARVPPHPCHAQRPSTFPVQDQGEQGRPNLHNIQFLTQSTGRPSLPLCPCTSTSPTPRHPPGRCSGVSWWVERGPCVLYKGLPYKGEKRAGDETGWGRKASSRPLPKLSFEYQIYCSCSYYMPCVLVINN